MERYYKLCQQHMGKVARITDRNGRVHVGRIERVTNRKVYIRPVGGSRGGFGFGYWGGLWLGCSVWHRPWVHYRLRTSRIVLFLKEE